MTQTQRKAILTAESRDGTLRLTKAHPATFRAMLHKGLVNERGHLTQAGIEARDRLIREERDQWGTVEIPGWVAVEWMRRASVAAMFGEVTEDREMLREVDAALRARWGDWMGKVGHD